MKQEFVTTQARQLPPAKLVYADRTGAEIEVRPRPNLCAARPSHAHAHAPMSACMHAIMHACLPPLRAPPCSLQLSPHTTPPQPRRTCPQVQPDMSKGQ